MSLRLPPANPIGTLALALMCTMTAMGLQSGFGVLYPAMVREEGWSVSEATAAFSISQLVYAPLAISGGVLLDRFGVRPVMLAGVAVLGLGLAWLSRASSLLEMYFAWTSVAAVGLAGVGYVSMFKLLSLRAGERFPQMLGVAVAGSGLGAMISAPAFQLAIDLGGWRLAVGAAALIIPAVLLPLVLLTAPGASNQSRRDRPAEPPPKPLLTEPGVWMFFLAGLGRGYLMLFQTHQVAHLLQVGFAASYAAGMAGLFGLAQAASSPLTGWPVARWGSPRVELGALALIVLSAGALAASTPAAPWLPLVYVVAAAMGRNALGISQNSLARRQFGSAMFGRVAAVAEIGFALGSFLGPSVAALLYDQTDSYVPGVLTSIPAVVVALVYTFYMMGRRSNRD